MQRISIRIAMTVLVASAAFGALSPPYAEWAEGPASHLMTKEETAQWNRLATDEEGEAFIALFWARRDPTPGTPENEFRKEFDARVAAADENFTTLKTRGSLSDRGRALILLGPPSLVGGQGPGQRAAGMSSPNPGAGGPVNVPGATPDAGRQVWTWSGERKPEFARGKQLEILFLDTAGRGEWFLATTERNNPEFVLQRAIGSYLFQPDLTEAPRFEGDIPASGLAAAVRVFQSPTLRTVYDNFRTGEETEVGPGKLTWEEFAAPKGDNFVAVQVFVPSGSGIAAGQNLTLLGVIENEAGEIVQIYEEAVTLADSHGDAFVDRTLWLQPGTYSASFGLVDGDRLLTMARKQMTVHGVDASVTGTSPLLLSNNIFPRQDEWSSTDPFTFGGLKVIPKGDARFAPAGDLWYFTELRKPGLDETGSPKVQVKVDIKGTTPTGPVQLVLPMSAVDVAKLHGTEDRWAVGLAIPLEGFKPGQYTMKVRVVDVVLKNNYDFEKTFEIRGL